MHTLRNPLLVCVGTLTAALPTTCLFLSVNLLFFVPLLVGVGCVVVGCVQIRNVKKRTMTAGALVLCLAAAIGPFVLTAYANRSGNPIRIVLPVGYRGEFRIVKDRAKGQELKLQDGVWVFEIPADGVLRVNDDQPFYMWHQFSCVDLDAHPVTVADLGTTAGSIQTGPGSWRSSSKYDGTKHRWKVAGSLKDGIDQNGR